MRKSNWNLKSDEEKNEVIQNRKEGLLNKYGVDNASLVEEIQKKRQDTFNEKYGGNPMLDERVREKLKNTLMSTYGVTNVSQLPEIREKIASKIRKPFNEVIEDLKKYNISPLFSPDEYKGKKKYTYHGSCLICNHEFDFHFIKGVKPTLCPNCKKSKHTSIRYQNVVERLQRFNMTPLFEPDDYTGRYSTESKQIKCNQCSNILDYVISVSNDFVCPICNPSSNTSNPEIEIKEWLESLGITNIITSTRKVISPLELDIYLPDYKLAIEFNGLYWHSEINGKTSKYHLNKSELCEEKSIHLIHIFEDEWRNKPTIVKSIIYSQLKLNKEKVMARKCSISIVSKKEEKEFLDVNHIQGYTNSKICYGLYYNNILISLMSFRKPRYNKNYDWELLRYSVLSDYIIIGGFARLLKSFRSNYSGSIISYSDKRMFKGNSYKQSGFIHKGSSKPNYYYIINNFLERKLRTYYQKHKLPKLLEKFDSTLSEWENMKMNGYDRIWDCGTDVWILE